MITAKASGKLYLAGEYAVVETGYPAIIAAVDKFVTVKVNKAKSENIGTLQSNRFTDDVIQWQRSNGKLKIDNSANQLEFILAAINLVEDYAKELGKKLSFYDIFVESELDSTSGRKYGLGSSAAVTVATVRALCMYYDLKIDDLLIYKLASIAHLSVQGNGSLGDIASSTYGGVIYYTSPDRNWILNEIDNKSLIEVLNAKWPNLNIEVLEIPKESELLIGWTGTPASTSILVDRISYSKAQKADDYSKFLSDSKLCLKNMLASFKENNLLEIQKQIRNNRTILRNLANFSQVSIENEKLRLLCDIAEKYNAAAKTSGAGGGDCGIAFVKKNSESKQFILNEWNQHNIDNLNLNIADPWR